MQATYLRRFKGSVTTLGVNHYFREYCTIGYSPKVEEHKGGDASTGASDMIWYLPLGYARVCPPPCLPTCRPPLPPPSPSPTPLASRPADRRPPRTDDDVVQVYVSSRLRQAV